MRIRACARAGLHAWHPGFNGRAHAPGHQQRCQWRHGETITTLCIYEATARGLYSLLTHGQGHQPETARAQTESDESRECLL